MGRREMNAHVSAILLGVNDMEKSKRFYTEGLGWKIQNDYKISVFFVPHGGSLVGFYGRDGLAADVGVNPQGSGFSGVALNYVVRSEKRVDEVMDEAKKAGAKILKPAAKLQWGGYGGSFADPDGYVWRIGYSAQGSDQPYAEERGGEAGEGGFLLAPRRPRGSPPRAPPRAARRPRDSRAGKEPR